MDSMFVLECASHSRAKEEAMTNARMCLDRNDRGDSSYLSLPSVIKNVNVVAWTHLPWNIALWSTGIPWNVCVVFDGTVANGCLPAPWLWDCRSGDVDEKPDDGVEPKPWRLLSSDRDSYAPC